MHSRKNLNFFYFSSASFQQTIINDSKVILDRLEAIFYECQKEEQIPDELRNLLTKHKNLDNKQAAKEINNYLYEKYDQKDWLVLVYNGVSGFNNHKLLGNFHFTMIYLFTELIHYPLSKCKKLSH